MPYRFLFATLLLCCTAQGSAASRAELEAGLDQVKAWVHGGYDTTEQAAADVAAGVPDELKHRVMFQLFAPARIPALDGYLVYQQASVDGSTDPDRIWRNGVLQFFVDDGTSSIRMRELNFREPESFYNAQFELSRLESLTADDFKWDAGCDFYLLPDAANNRLIGPIGENSCRMQAPGTGQELVAEDEVVITPDEFWFLGRFVDAAGRTMWGNASEEHVKMRRRSSLATVLRPDGGVLIVGATRNTGLELARLLTARGDIVTAFVRPGSDRSGLDPLEVRIAEGDAMDPASVDSAMSAANYTAVVSTLGCYGCDNPPDYLGNRNVFDAAVAAGIDRVIMISTLGAGDSADTPPFPVKWFLGDVMELKTRAEDHLVDSGLSYTIIRPGALKDAPATGNGLLTEDTDALGVITRADLAQLVVDCLDDDTTAGAVYSAKDSEMTWPWSMF